LQSGRRTGALTVAQKAMRSCDKRARFTGKSTTRTFQAPSGSWSAFRMPWMTPAVQIGLLIRSRNAGVFMTGIPGIDGRRWRQMGHPRHGCTAVRGSARGSPIMRRPMWTS